MSDDAKLMFKYCVAVETGVYDNFVYLKISNCSTARWITFGTRLLRVYMSDGLHYNSHMAECLERMVSFIVYIYYKVGTWEMGYSFDTSRDIDELQDSVIITP